MKIEQVKKMSPLDRVLYWIKERESIRLKKEAGQPAPWSDDEILQRYRFCNVRRMDDKVSRWLMDNWYQPYKDHPNILLAVVLARNFNNPESLVSIGFPKKWDPKRCEKILNNRVENGLKNFNPAYVVTGTLGGTKVQQILYKVADQIYKNPPDVNTSSIEQTAKLMIPYNGFSDFMAGQVVADLRWAMPGKWTDKNTWAPKGPGSIRGMNRLNQRPITQKIPRKQFQEGIQHLISVCKSRLSETITGRMEAHDYQNCFCEFDKYERTLWEGRRPKQLYRGGV